MQLQPGIALQMTMAELAVELNGLKGYDTDAASISLSGRAELLQLKCQAGCQGASATVRLPCSPRCAGAEVYQQLAITAGAQLMQRSLDASLSRDNAHHHASPCLQTHGISACPGVIGQLTL